MIGGNGSGPKWPKVRIRACTPCTTFPSRSAVVVNSISERDRNLANRQRRSKRHGDDIRRDRWDAEQDAPMGFLLHLSPRSSLGQTTVESNKTQGRKGRHEP